MSIKCCKFNPSALVVLGILIGVFLVIPPCFAGGAVTLVPAKNTDVPDGSYIPKHRIEEIRKKVAEYKAKMKAETIKQQQERSPQNKLPKTKP